MLISILFKILEHCNGADRMASTGYPYQAQGGGIFGGAEGSTILLWGL